MKKKPLKPKPRDLPEWLRSAPPPPESGTKPTGKAKTSASPHVEKGDEELLAEALVLLGIKAADLEASPRITHLFKGIGGQDKIFEYLSGSEEPDARKLMELRSRLNRSQREATPFEAYCVAAVIPVKKVFGLIAAEAMDQEEKAKQLLFRVKHSEVVEATIENALGPFGAADRRMLHQAAGFVPVPKNSVTHIHGNQMIDNREQTTNIAVLPPVEDTVRRLGDRFNEKVMDVKALPAAEPAMLEVGDEGEE